VPSKLIWSTVTRSWWPGSKSSTVAMTRSKHKERRSAHVQIEVRQSNKCFQGWGREQQDLKDNCNDLDTVAMYAELEMIERLGKGAGTS
jgi:hypothetical protein